MGIRKTKSFSLIELLVVVAVLATLAAMVLPFVANHSQKARITKAQAQVSSIKSAIVQFQGDYGLLANKLVVCGASAGSQLSTTDAIFSLTQNQTFVISSSSTTNTNLEDVLDGTDNKVNKRGIKILSEELVKPFLSTDNNYYIAIDGDGDGLVTIPANALYDGSSEIEASATIGVYTQAPDNSDAEIKTW